MCDACMEIVYEEKQRIEAERDALKAENSKLRDALLHLLVETDSEVLIENAAPLTLPQVHSVCRAALSGAKGKE